MSSRPELKLDWATHKAAKYAVEHWHYSGCLPAGKSVKVGVWENSKFIGVVVFGMGSGNATNGLKYGLTKTHEVAELARIALDKHKTPVSRIISIAVKLFTKQSPGIRLLISFADTDQGHVGGIYQGGNWVYTGIAGKAGGWNYLINGKWVHKRTLGSRYGRRDTAFLDRLFPNAEKRQDTTKHRYLMPLDNKMAAIIEPLSKPYPKREKQAMGVPASQRRGSTDLHAPII